MSQLPRAIYSLKQQRNADGSVPGFDVLHEPHDESPCDEQDGTCRKIEHLWPIARIDEN